MSLAALHHCTTAPLHHCTRRQTPDMLHPAPRDLLAAASSRQRLPLTTDYTPAVAESQSESQLRHPDLAFAADPGSSRVFAGTTLLFQTEKEFKDSKVANKKIYRVVLLSGYIKIWLCPD